MALGSDSIQHLTQKMADITQRQGNVLDDMDNENRQLADVNEDIGRTNNETLGLFGTADNLQAEIDALNADTKMVNDQRNIDLVKISDQCVRDCEEAEKAKDTRIHLQKFVDESGMCGMGMGMGNTYSECGAIDLTAEELVALKDELLQLGDSQETFDSNFEQITCALNEKLKSSGSEVSNGKDDDGTSFLEIKRSDGSSVKIYDANGNGALDNKDYDFCQAIQQAEKIIQDMNDKIDSINKKAQADVAEVNRIADEHIQANENKIAELQKTKDATLDMAKHNMDDVLPELQKKADMHEDNYQADKAELNNLDENKEVVSGQLDKANKAEELAEAEEAEVPEEVPEEEKPEVKPEEEPVA